MQTTTLIDTAVGLSGLAGYTGTFRPLGGGEANDSYALGFHSAADVVLRVARYPDQLLLKNEAHALRLLEPTKGIPKLVFFEPHSRIDGKQWIMESCVEGRHAKRLSLVQFASLGELLARVHAVRDPSKQLDLWKLFVSANSYYASEEKLLHHPHPRMHALMKKGVPYIKDWQSIMKDVVTALVHADVTPSNILTSDDTVALVDWEFARFSDPLMDFSTIYYPDMEYNQGKWRIQITSAERTALFAGYQSAGGQIDTERIAMWMNFDKLGAALYQYWRIHESGRPTTKAQLAQYTLDFNTLLASLERSL